MRKITPTFEKPASLGTDFVDASVFPELRQVFREIDKYTTYDSLSWPDDLKSEYESRQKILKILAEVTENLRKYAAKNYNKSIDQIGYMVLAHDVAPGRVQTSYNGDPGGWHVDTEAGGLAKLFVSNAMPTQFLTDNDRLGFWAKRARKKLVDAPRSLPYDFEPEAVDRALAKNAVAIYQPEAYEAVIAEKPIHQSPINTLDITVPRVLLTAFMYDPNK